MADQQNCTNKKLWFKHNDMQCVASGRVNDNRKLVKVWTAQLSNHRRDLCTFCHTLPESISPAFAMLFASTADTSRKPWELTGFKPSDASMDESASKYTLCGQSESDKKCMCPLYSPILTVPSAGSASCHMAAIAVRVDGSK